MFDWTILAQESSGTQGVLGPTKIYLAVQPPDPQPPVQKNIIVNTTTQTAAKPIESTSLPSVPVENNALENSTQIKTSEQVRNSYTC